MDFGLNLRRLRKAAGLTQEALGEKLHLSGQAVSRWETGDGYPEITLLPALAELFGVTVDALLRPAKQTAEERYAVTEKALRLEQEGRREEAIDLMEEQLRLHPEEDFLRHMMARSLILHARQMRREGRDKLEKLALRKAKAAAEELRSSRDPWLRRQPETMLPEIYYLLRERDKLEELSILPSEMYYASLMSCAVGKDYVYTFERAVLEGVTQLADRLGSLAFRKPKGSANLFRAGPDEPGSPLLYDSCPGEGEWTVSDEDRFEIQHCRLELLETFSGGEGFGTLREMETGVISEMLDLAAEMKDREKLLETLELYVGRFASRELAEWELKRVLALDSYHLAMQKKRRDGSRTPEVAAIALLTPAERELLTEPFSPVPMLKHVQLFRVYLRDPPLLPLHLEKTAAQLKDGSFDFVREEPRFRAAEDALRGLVSELKAAGELPVKNMEERRGLPQ